MLKTSRAWAIIDIINILNTYNITIPVPQQS